MNRYTTTEYGKQNMFAHEPQIQVDHDHDYWKEAESTNGRLAMIGSLHWYITISSLDQLYLAYFKTKGLYTTRIASHF